MYEPKNRKVESLPVLQILIDHADGTIKCCPNALALSAAMAMSGEKIEVGPGFLGEGSEVFNPLELKPADAKSIISGAPAVVYRADDLEIPLTPEELFRFMKHDLKPEEYLALRGHFGMFYEIHEDFYEPDHHFACQPMGRDILDDPEDEGPALR